METQTKTFKERLKELKKETKILIENRKEKHRPTVWYNAKSGNIEIHFDNRTILARVTNIDKETPREDSDWMAKGSGYRQIIYQTEVEE